jgi:hypothetical protein
MVEEGEMAREEGGRGVTRKWPFTEQWDTWQV